MAVLERYHINRVFFFEQGEVGRSEGYPLVLLKDTGSKKLVTLFYHSLEFKTTFVDLVYNLRFPDNAVSIYQRAENGYFYCYLFCVPFPSLTYPQTLGLLLSGLSALAQLNFMSDAR